MAIFYPKVNADRRTILPLAVALHEDEAERFLDAMGEADTRLISAASVLEAAEIIKSRRGPPMPSMI